MYDGGNDDLFVCPLLVKRRSIQEAIVHKRERFVIYVTCPVCALRGSATWEVNESENLEMTIKSLSHGFPRGGPHT
jgi:hypothetical protein